VGVTTHTVLHHLVFGCLLVFFISFVPLFTMQGVEGQIFRTYGANLWLCAAGRTACDLHGDAGAGLAAASEARRDFWIRASLPPTISLDAGTEATGRMRAIFLRHPEVRPCSAARSSGCGRC
jgi:hypothetical protein